MHRLTHPQVERGEDDLRREVTCPVTTSIMTKPFANSACGHVFEYEGIRAMLGKKPTVKCPVAGCDKTVKLSNLTRCQRTEKKIARFHRQQEHLSQQQEGEELDEDEDCTMVE